MINFLLYTMLVLATAVANAFIDAYLIKKKWGKIKSLNHNSRAFIRICVFATGMWLLFDYTFFRPFLIGLYSLFLFNIVFDLLLNRLRGLPWYYDGKDAITDNISEYFNKEATEFVAYIELGAKSVITLILAVWILAI